jgi:hypothetical protein
MDSTSCEGQIALINSLREVEKHILGPEMRQRRKWAMGWKAYHTHDPKDKNLKKNNLPLTSRTQLKKKLNLSSHSLKNSSETPVIYCINYGFEFT